MTKGGQGMEGCREKERTMDNGKEWDIIDTATREISVQIGSDPASEAVRDYLWRARDPKGRKMNPMPGIRCYVNLTIR
jgi:hypothetical protein